MSKTSIPCLGHKRSYMWSLKKLNKIDRLMEWSVAYYLRKGGNRKRKIQNKTYIQRLLEPSNE